MEEAVGQERTGLHEAEVEVYFPDIPPRGLQTWCCGVWRKVIKAR